MKINYIIASIFILNLSFSTGLAQEKSKKARYKSLSERNITTDQSVPSLLEQAESLIASDPSRSLDLVEQALATSITQKSTFNEAKCYIVLGKLNESQHEFELANQNYSDAYQRLVNGYDTTENYQESLYGLGRVNYDLSNFNKSKSFYSQILKLEIEEEERLEIELILADIEVALGEETKALDRVTQLEPSPAYNQSNSLQSKGRAVKARAYAQQENFAAAEESLSPTVIKGDQKFGDESLSQGDFEAVEEETQDIETEELLNIYQQQSRKEEEIELREKIAESKADANLPLEAAKQRQEIGKVLIEQGRDQEAIRQLEEAVLLASSKDDYEEQANAYLVLAKAYQAYGNSLKALNAYEQHSKAMANLSKQEKKKRSLRESLLKKQQDIQELTKDLALDESSYLLEETTTELQEQQLKSQRLLIYGLIFVLLAVLIVTYFIYVNAQKTKRVGQLLALKSLRSQMNPHFIFNALNSVNQFIALNDERAANKFLTDFSRLMRMVLDNSQKEFISLREEEEMISLYLKLEHYRFRDQFDYDLVIDSSLDLDDIDIPPMLIQPYVENAIWHGLRYKTEKGKLLVSINQNGAGIKICVEDDGIGRKESARIKTDNQRKKNSVGLKNTQERVDIVNQIYGTNYSINISDRPEDNSGTRVEILAQ